MPSTMVSTGYSMVYKIDIVHAIMEHGGKYWGEVENTVKEIHKGILIAWAQVRAVPQLQEVAEFRDLRLS